VAVSLALSEADVGGTGFGELLMRVAEVDPEMRVRFQSPHPKVRPTHRSPFSFLPYTEEEYGILIKEKRTFSLYCMYVRHVVV